VASYWRSDGSPPSDVHGDAIISNGVRRMTAAKGGSHNEVAKVVVVTGASAGIGAELARQLATAGHTVVLAARSEPALRQVAAECGPQALAVVADVRVRADVERLRDRALEAFGRVDVWVNNVGRGIHRPVLELTDADLDEMIAVNLRSALYGMQAIVPHFMARGAGHVVNVSSVLGRVPVVATPRSAYSAAKAALDVLTADLRVELRRSHPGIHVSLVVPGPVATDFARHAVASPGGYAPAPGATQRVERPQEVAAAIVALIADPVAECYSDPAAAGLTRRYRDDVAAFEAALVAAGTATGR
jgi:short-subunit dehydrogenase